MTTVAAPVMLLSLADVALLAKVQRPVATMWRRRPASTPFPEPVRLDRGQPQFEGHQIAEWLTATGRGNNRHAADDLAAFASPDDPQHQEAAFLALTGLVCLAASTEILPTDVGALLDLADAADPDDQYLYSEVAGAGPQLESLARYALLLVDAAYHPAAAFDRLMDQRTRRQPLAGAAFSLTEVAQRLLARVALALADESGLVDPVYVDLAPGGSDLLVTLARLGKDREISVATPDPSEPRGRLALRRLLVHGIRRTRLVESEPGEFVLPPRSVGLLQLPFAGGAEMSDLQVLQLIDRILLDSPSGQHLVVIGPASALADRPAVVGRAPGRPSHEATWVSAVADVRGDILRSHRLRAAVRLPAGLLRTRPRQQTALWCFGPGQMESVGDRTDTFTVTADLSNTRLDDGVIEGLITDILAGQRGGVGRRRHSPQFAAATATTSLINQQRRVLVAPRALRTGIDPVVDLLDRIDSASRALADPFPPLAPRVVPGEHTDGLPPTTVDDLCRTGRLVILAGVRMVAADIDLGDRGAQVIGPSEVSHPWDGVRRSIDRLMMAARYPAADYTQPGDVVFITAQRPAAIVDRHGGSVVVFPARILRCTDPGLVPAVVAEDINAQPAGAKAWRGWSLRRTPLDQAGPLAAVLDQVDSYRANLYERLALLDSLAGALVDGTAAGTLQIAEPEPAPPSKGR